GAEGVPNDAPQLLDVAPDLLRRPQRKHDLGNCRSLASLGTTARHIEGLDDTAKRAKLFQQSGRILEQLLAIGDVLPSAARQGDVMRGLAPRAPQLTVDVRARRH